MRLGNIEDAKILNLPVAEVTGSIEASSTTGTAGSNRTTTRRRIAVSLAPAAAILSFQQVVFPVSSGVFIRGLIVGALTALVALGLVLVYRTNRIVNFAQADMGFAPAVLAFLLMTESGLPWAIAAVVGFAIAIAVGAGTERLIVRRLFRSSRLVVTLAVIALSQVLAGAAIVLSQWWDVDVAGTPAGTLLPAPVEWTVTLGGVDFGASDLLALVIAPACIAFLITFLRRSNVGVAIRASADSADRAWLLGVPIFRLQSLVWMMVAGLGFVAVFLRSGILGLPLFEPALAFPVLLRALAAFLLGRTTDLARVTSIAVALGALELGVAENHDPLMMEPILAAMVVVALVLRWRTAGVHDDAEGHRARREGARQEDDDWPPVLREIRPVPEALAKLPQVRVVRIVLLALAGWMALSLPMALSTDAVQQATTLLVYTLLGLSVVLLSGWAGRLSLGQVAYFAVGAAVGAWTVLRWDLDLVLAAACATLVGALVAVAVGLPTLRKAGHYVTLTTFAFSLAAAAYLLSPQFFDWVPAGSVERAPLVAGWDVVSGDLRVYYLVLAVLVPTMVGVRNIRSTCFGRATVAARDNGRAARSYGVDEVKVQLAVYAMAGAIAAGAGALFMHSELSYDVRSYEPLENLAVLTMVVAGGMTSVAGAVLGALFLVGIGWLLPSGWTMVLVGTGAIVVLLSGNGGLAGGLFALRDRYLRSVVGQTSLDVPTYTDVVPVTAPDAGSAVDASSNGGDRNEGHGQGHDGALLELSNLTVDYGAASNLSGVSIQVRAGEAVALLGAKGSGKSTLLRAVSGLVPPHDGTVTFAGQAVGGRPPFDHAHVGLVALPAGLDVFPSLTVAENLRVASWPHREDPKTAAAGVDRVVGLFPVLGRRAGDLAADLSAGEQQMLALAMAVVSRPKLLMVDGLSLGLDRAGTDVRALVRCVQHLQDEGVALLLVEPSVSLALELADRAVFLDRGEISFDGSRVELARRPDLLRSIAPARKQRRFDVVDLDIDDIEILDVRVESGTEVEEKGEQDKPTPVLEVRDVTKRFGGVAAVDDVTFQVARGEIVGVVGPDGAGKTVLLDIVSGMTKPDTGTVLLDGRDVGSLRPVARARRGLGRSFQDVRLFPSLTVDEAIAVPLERWVPGGDPVSNALRLPIAVRSEETVRQRVDELVDLLDLGPYRSSFLGELPVVTRRLVDLACLLAHRPAVVLLDEPAAGLSRDEVQALAPSIQLVRDELDAGVVIAGHDVSLAEEVADRLVALDRGRMLVAGAPSEVLARHEVISSYLGNGREAVAVPDRSVPVMPVLEEISSVGQQDA